MISFNPWGQLEGNPDHWVTGRAVEQACWMAAMANDFPEHLESGLETHAVLEGYYFYARPGQPYNRVADITSHVGKKIDAIAECKSQGGGNLGSQLRARLERKQEASVAGERRSHGRPRVHPRVSSE